MYFCIYLDSNYLHRALVCLYSLFKFDKNIVVFVLCFDDETFLEMEKIRKNGFNLKNIPLVNLENQFPELVNIKGTRSAKEYYATTSPILPLYIFNNYKNIDEVYYTDADMCFFGDPHELENIFVNKSIMVTDQEFEPPRNNVRFNVGVLGYRNDNHGIEFLNWWKDRCIEWCFWITTPEGLCADQGYLNVLHDDPNKFKNHIVCPNPGVNIGPWNLFRHSVGEEGGILKLDGKHKLICYHFHEFKYINENKYYATGWKYSENDIKYLYDPYFQLMKKAICGDIFNGI